MAKAKTPLALPTTFHRLDPVIDDAWFTPEGWPDDNDGTGLPPHRRPAPTPKRSKSNAVGQKTKKAIPKKPKDRG